MTDNYYLKDAMLPRNPNEVLLSELRGRTYYTADLLTLEHRSREAPTTGFELSHSPYLRILHE